MDQIQIYFPICLFAISGLVYGAFIFYDRWNLPGRSGNGRVTGKTLIHAHIQAAASDTDGVGSFHPVYIPEECSVFVEVDGQEDWVWVDRKVFDSLSEDDMVPVDYAKGRITGNVYLKQISPA